MCKQNSFFIRVKYETLPQTMKLDMVRLGWNENFPRTPLFQVYIISSICRKHANFLMFAKVDNLFTKQLLTWAIYFLLMTMFLEN